MSIMFSLYSWFLKYIIVRVPFVDQDECITNNVFAMISINRVGIVNNKYKMNEAHILFYYLEFQHIFFTILILSLI